MALEKAKAAAQRAAEEKARQEAAAEQARKLAEEAAGISVQYKQQTEPEARETGLVVEEYDNEYNRPTGLAVEGFESFKRPTGLGPIKKFEPTKFEPVKFDISKF